GEYHREAKCRVVLHEATIDLETKRELVTLFAHKGRSGWVSNQRCKSSRAKRSSAADGGRSARFQSTTQGRGSSTHRSLPGILPARIGCSVPDSAVAAGRALPSAPRPGSYC